jgi:hypothetical protein
MTGFDGVSFASLLQKFAPLFDEYTPFNTSHILLKQDPLKGGRPRKVRPEDCLGLVLVWTLTRGALTALQLIFGMTCSNLCVYLRFGHRVIVEALKSDSLAKIAIPSNEEIASYKEAVGAIYPLLSDVWSTMDGLKLYLQQSGNTEIQARFYNGWTHGHYVTSVFVFCPDGTILKDTFVYEDTGEHRILMKMVCLLYNLHARTIGINQIKNVFMKHLNEDANNEFNMV